MALLEKLMEVTEIIRKGKMELERQELLELADIVRYIPDKNKAELYDYLMENEPVLGQRIEKETMSWLTDIFQNMGELSPEELYIKTRHLH